MNELIIYTDESEKEGKFYSNFYGGVLIRSQDLETVIRELESFKESLNLYNELKWVKVTENYLEKYIAFIDRFFDFVEDDKVKVRIMFTQNCFVPVNLTKEQRQNEYFLLYYQFFKHIFGLPYCILELEPPVRIRINLDQMPTTKESSFLFKSYLEGLSRNAQFKKAGVFIDREQIAEVDSKKHILLQCLDIVLGAMAFRLNDKHKEKPNGQRCRGKRTIAKEKLYKHILQRIRRIYPNFNIGETTGHHLENHWLDPYRHWKFVAKGAQFDSSKTKK
ncbi:MAG: DUF3800 domain-containing protein [Thermoguttaceae bacterium]|nr:DUF3800 domain-containing protein [Thermoguttaceae bacterium]